MPDIYIVQASRGEYSDRSEWSVAAYSDEAKAQAHIELAEARERELRQQWEHFRKANPHAIWHTLATEIQNTFRNQYDHPEGTWSSYEDTSFFLATVPLLDAVPGVVLADEPVDPNAPPARTAWDRLEDEDD